MYERTLQSALRYLATVPGGSARVRDVWTSVRKEAKAGSFEECSLADFAALLDADIRFDIVGNGFNPDETSAETLDEQDRGLFDLGFCATCTVRLRTSLESEESDEMPSITHRHLSETRPVPAAAPGKKGSGVRPKKRRTLTPKTVHRARGRKISHS